MTDSNYKKHYRIVKDVKTLPIKDYLKDYVDFNTTLSACRKCPAYNRNWACPEFDRNYSEFYNSYEKIDLIYVKLIFDDYIRQKKLTQNQWDDFLHETLFNEKDKLTEELKVIEKNKNGIYLSSGYCNICKECSKINGEECMFPNLRRNSVESIGGLVVKITREIFDTQLKWIDESGKVPEYLSILNAVMY
ncbi:MAG: hypothetical protein BZ137_01185 [Methanosphaera sp. rholeuAM130]|nr:MAG: hypothetical protein BZ137_01185 [Methanosphaera sp. rholeuAM130]